MRWDKGQENSQRWAGAQVREGRLWRVPPSAGAGGDHSASPCSEAVPLSGSCQQNAKNM